MNPNRSLGSQLLWQPKRRNGRPSADDPSPEEIEAIKAEIRSTWGERTERHRRTGKADEQIFMPQEIDTHGIRNIMPASVMRESD